MQTECLVVGDMGTSLELRVRFLQLAASRDDDSKSTASDTVEREVTVAVQMSQIVNRPHRVAFSFRSADVRIMPLEGTVVVSAIEVGKRPENGSRSHARQSVGRTGKAHALASVATAVEVGERLFKLTVVIENLTRCDDSDEWDLDRALLRSLISTHTMLRVEAGEFLSLLDPPEPYADHAATCRNVGAWPVLVGPEKGRMMLSSPIILADDPQIAPESPGDLFDGTEIDEILTLRIQTLTDDEKAQMKAGGEQVRRMLERTESLTEAQLSQMHGRFTSVKTQPPTLDFQPGDHVRLQPRGRADAFDLLLKGQLATIISIEHDFEDRVHLCVVIDDDPGKDFGEQGLPAHRFFFNPDEVERLELPP